MQELWGRARPADRVARAMRAVPRARFLPASLRHRAGEDAPLPIGEGQTNSQPTTVENMLRLLDVREGHRVLDLGAGSGWTTALLAHLVGPTGTVLGLERQESLLGPARAALAETVPEGRARIRTARRGVLGAPEDAPFDRILVSAGAEQLPPALPAQLGEGGILVIPVAQQLRRIARRGDALEETVHGAYLFVPLIEDRP
ncbi:protein-L-isoaspartate carboxylmethyltransferase [Brachybacterium vulturis]|uniref:Protein-L-isoaspartate O-methyltransferase n=1 Tax=Brachybacterium vulturis TaxID=2017484 RepID=A0A291GLE3_9MICO|nr:methyltransferase domain-containing protein [Brachybacterium vulturis]ATG51323.1 protein-L-isoaspartate carboxylmethyltransferase [Brachybacterium vulturis]